MDHARIGRILHMYVERVADAHPQHRPRHPAVEGPVAEGRPLGEPAFEFDREQVDPHRLRRAIADRRRHLGGDLRDVGFHHLLCRRPRRHQELPLHAGELVAGHAAEIGEVAGALRAEHHGGAGAAPGDARRTSLLVREDDIVLGALAVEQRDLHHLPLGGGQHRVDLSVDRTADAEIDHAALGNAGAQRVAHVRDVTHRDRGRRCWRAPRPAAAGGGSRADGVACAVCAGADPPAR